MSTTTTSSPRESDGIDEGRPVRFLGCRLPGMGADMARAAESGDIPEVKRCAALVKGFQMMRFKPAGGGAFRTTPVVTV